MTNEEAKKELEKALDNNTIYDVEESYKYIIAMHMAIKALEQQQNIITQIEQARDKDKNCGEYPYNRCIEIIKGVNDGQ